MRRKKNMILWFVIHLFSRENNSVKDILARQQVELTFRNLIQKTADVLSSLGIFSVIIPSESAQEFENLAEDFDLYLVRKVNIFGIEKRCFKTKCFRIF